MLALTDSSADPLDPPTIRLLIPNASVFVAASGVSLSDAENLATFIYGSDRWKVESSGLNYGKLPLCRRRFYLFALRSIACMNLK